MTAAPESAPDGPIAPEPDTVTVGRPRPAWSQGPAPRLLARLSRPRGTGTVRHRLAMLQSESITFTVEPEPTFPATVRPRP